jgi:hypothetical protein
MLWMLQSSGLKWFCLLWVPRPSTAGQAAGQVLRKTKRIQPAHTAALYGIHQTMKYYA